MTRLGSRRQSGRSNISHAEALGAMQATKPRTGSSRSSLIAASRTLAVTAACQAADPVRLARTSNFRRRTSPSEPCTT
ncbi:hypothetical protein ACFSEO_09230 [Agromyces cerinus subsp. nitratus]|uniref:hypothetical protein n=1 Tax=Agromyces cerinus TaxID=33878 RepID=UPI003629E66C